MMWGMEEPVVLEYGGSRVERPLCRRALVAFVMGLCSGPMALGVACLIGGLGAPIELALLMLIVCHLAPILFSARVLVWMKHRHEDMRGRDLAIGGGVATLGWIAIEMAVITYFASQTL
jgi:hypothetical protein